MRNASGPRAPPAGTRSDPGTSPRRRLRSVGVPEKWEYGQLRYRRIHEKNVWPHELKLAVEWWAPGATEAEFLSAADATLAALNRLGADGWELLQIEEERIAIMGGAVQGVPTDRTDWVARYYWMKRKVS